MIYLNQNFLNYFSSRHEIAPLIEGLHGYIIPDIYCIQYTEIN